MEPESTLAEVARMLRPGGIFAAYDYQWPPTVDWKVEPAYEIFIERAWSLKRERQLELDLQVWSKNEHLCREHIFSSQPFALLWIGQTISTLGDGVSGIALAWLVLLLTGSATAMGLVIAVQILPTVLLLLMGGVTADRFSRRLVMLWSDGGRALVTFLIVGLGWFHLLHLWHLLVLALIFGVVDSFFSPAYSAIMPQLVSTEDLPSANALTALSRQMGRLLCPLMGAACVAITGPVIAFAFDGLTFIISALCLLPGHLWRDLNDTLARAGAKRQIGAREQPPNAWLIQPDPCGVSTDGDTG